jgi:hypothetical protein
MGIEGESAIHLVDAFRHADQPQPSAAAIQMRSSRRFPAKAKPATYG